MAQQHDDCCIVCADPLEFTAFGSCGHNEVCSKCVARMRFVLKDKACVFCRQDNPQVFFTRFMGDYTARLGPDEFQKLQARADRRELFALQEINGYFDDERHFSEIRALCGYTHPILDSAGKGAPKFNNFNSLKRHVETTYNQFFCDMCVKGRKVFVSEQLLYTKDGLKRHQETGDETGILAESRFKGHPLCKFCRTRFYDANELYRHMEGSHEHCFLCRRAAPDQYVYYRHYKELEDHFTKDHHPCPHPTCLERKFVVFSTEYELKAHFAAEHGDEMKMSGAQRRQAMTIPLQLQFRSRDDEETEPSASARLERAAVVIGGGHNIGSRAARPGRVGGGGMHHSRSEPQIAQAASSGQDGAGEVSSITFTAEDFPAPSSSQQGAAGPLGRWAAFTGAQASAGGLSAEDFPALPTLSKNQRRRLKEQQRTLAERLSAAAQPPRVLNRAVAAGASSSFGASGGTGPSSSGAKASSDQASLGAADFPALSAATPSSTGPASSSTGGVSAPAAATTSFSATRAADVLSPPSQQRRPPGFGREEFPALGGGTKATPPSPPPAASSAYAGAASGVASSTQPSGLSQTDVLNNLFMRPGSAAAITGGASAGSPAASAPVETAAQLKAEDFPSLPGGSKAAGKGRAGMARQSAQLSPAKPALAPAAATPADRGARAASSNVPSGVSDSLKAANKALVERIKRQLSGAAFDTFRQQSQQFMRGDLQADEYHDYMVSLGLLSVAAELASLCPDPSKRRQLLDVHRAFILSPAAQDPGLVGAGWMPPEAAVAKANRVAQHSAWGCPRCSLCNAPDDARCETCGAARPSEEEQLAASMAMAASLQPPVPLATARYGVQHAAPAAPSNSSAASQAPPAPSQMVPAAEDFPALAASGARRGGAASAASGSGSGNGNVFDLPRADSSGADDGFPSASSNGSGKGKKGKGTTIKIGLPTSGAASSSSARAHPQNVWTQPAFKAKAANQWAGQGGGKLAKMHGAINDAWGDS